MVIYSEKTNIEKQLNTETQRAQRKTKAKILNEKIYP